MFVVLHGDARPANRANSYAFAQAVVKAVPKSAALAILRPGYADAMGNASPGERGAGTGDNYTSERLQKIAAAIASAKAQVPAARVILIGDNGGAAMAADLAGIRPRLIDGMVLVSCPCTLPEWRKYMKKRAPSLNWESPVPSLDPLKTAGGVRPDLRAAMLVGAKDEITPGSFSRPYAEALALRGIATDYRIVPDRGQLSLDDPEVLDATRRLVDHMPEKP
ncbi:hypothetical protein KY084_02140 [Stakelama sp. CBK3Z-3]|uniref:Alpha/beta hydrolase n=1 Tax=Stakelama flava TaxID=2860338 RepID=A0ABS6XIC7_9SPHN|nr:hypothetical protein [Stakelama flava]